MKGAKVAETMIARAAGFVLLALALALAGCGPDNIAATPVPVEQQQTRENALGTFYKLGPGDELQVSVFKHEDLSGDFIVDDRGVVALPLVGDVQANRLTVNEFQEAYRTHLADGYLVDPKVTVQVIKYRPFYILGGVEKPGAYEYQRGMSILNAVAFAGGHNKYAHKTLPPEIIRADDPSRAKREASVHDPVYPGDIIEIPSAPRPLR